MNDVYQRLTRTVRGANDLRRVATELARRPRTYPAIAREAAVGAWNASLLPVGIVRDVLKVENAFRLGDKHSPGHALRYLDPEAAATPIVLLHGYFHNRSAFVVMRRSLKRAGFAHVNTVNYNAFTHPIEELAESLAKHVEEVLSTVEAHQVHLVGHSLGGMVARYYVQKLGGDKHVHTCISLGTPHQGTYAAYVGRGAASRQVRPNTSLVRDLNTEAEPVRTRFVSFYSNLDGVIIPASNAKLSAPALQAENVLVRDLGHQTLLVSRTVTRNIIDRLVSLETENKVSDSILIPAPDEIEDAGA
jgi:triacylglycerol lipase